MEKDILVTRQGTRNQLKIDDVTYRLSSPEVNIFLSLYNNRGIGLSKDELLQIGWPDRVVTSNSIIVAIANLRKALRNHFPEELITTTTSGYLLSNNIDVNVITKLDNYGLTGITALNKEGAKNAFSNYSFFKKASDFNKFPRYFLFLSAFFLLAINTYLTSLFISYDSDYVFVSSESGVVRIITDEQLIPSLKDPSGGAEIYNKIMVTDLFDYLNGLNLDNFLNSNHSYLEIVSERSNDIIVQCISLSGVYIYKSTRDNVEGCPK